MWFPFTVLLARRNNIAKEEIKTDVESHIKKNKEGKGNKENNSGGEREREQKSLHRISKSKRVPKHDQSPVMIHKRHHHPWSVVVGLSRMIQR